MPPRERKSRTSVKCCTERHREESLHLMTARAVTIGPGRKCVAVHLAMTVIAAGVLELPEARICGQLRVMARRTAKLEVGTFQREWRLKVRLHGPGLRQRLPANLAVTALAALAEGRLVHRLVTAYATLATSWCARKVPAMTGGATQLPVPTLQSHTRMPHPKTAELGETLLRMTLRTRALAESTRMRIPVTGVAVAKGQARVARLVVSPTLVALRARHLLMLATQGETRTAMVKAL